MRPQREPATPADAAPQISNRGDAARELVWSTQRARQLVHAPYVAAEHVEFYERKAALLEYVAHAPGDMTPDGRQDAAAFARDARVKAAEHRARSGETQRPPGAQG